MNKNMKRKLRRAAKRAAVRGAGAVARKAGVKGLDRAVERSLNKVLSTPMQGSGFYSNGSGVIMGRGEYTLGGGQSMIEHNQPPVLNSLIAGGSGRHTSISQIGDETSDVSFTRSEYIGDIFVPANPSKFHNMGYAINPGLSGSFPWLSQVAANFSEYELIQCVLEYRPVVSKFSSTGQMGTIMLAANVNAADPIFTSKSEMIAHNGCEPTSVSGPSFVGIECDHRKNGGARSRFIRSGATPGGQDQKTYDMGTIQIATQGISETAFPAGTQLGMLYVHYKVILRKPRLYDALGKSQPCDVFIAGGTFDSSKDFLGSVPESGNYNSLGGRIEEHNRGVKYTFPDDFSGHVQIDVFKNGSVGGNQFALTIGADANITTHSNFETVMGTPAAEIIGSGSNSSAIFNLRIGAPESSEDNYVLITLEGDVTDVLTGGYMSIMRINPLNSDTTDYVPVVGFLSA